MGSMKFLLPSPTHGITRGLLGLIIALFFAGCGNFSRLAADIMESAGTLRLVSGSLQAPACERCELIVAVLGDERGDAIHNYRVFEHPGNFRIAALNTSRYLFAFQDLNRDFTYQDNEPGAWFDLAGRDIDRNSVADIVLEIGAPLVRPGPRVAGLFELRGTGLGHIDILLGKVTTIDDPRFDKEAAERGMWEPLGYMKTGHAGIFLLEPFDPFRIPVLFVHGINGTPQNFRALIDSLDRSRFQVWVINYPSGFDLRALGDGLLGVLAELRLRYDFQRMHIVAHSMGGLLIREYLSECSRARACDYVDKVISVATPYAGIENMSLYLDLATVVMPVWRNLLPDGPFLSMLFNDPLPPGASLHIAFAYLSDRSPTGKPGDGVVSLKTQLRDDAQREASSLRGFNEDHVSVLTSKELQAYVNAVLSR
jgi:pimeloyl-ACP methyl ester carboxylesterase